MAISSSIRKTTRKIEAAITGTEPTADLLDTLKDEHDEVKALMQEIVDATTSARRKALLKQVKMALVPHARAEEKVLYEALLKVRDKDANTDSEEGYIEHSLADRVLVTLGKIDNAMSNEFTAGAKVLKELLEHHIREEESDIWSDAREHFDVAERQKMNAKYLKAKVSVRIPS